MIISLTNHKGGTGKTTTALNLAAGLAKSNKNVLLIDFDAQANLSYSLGVPGPEYDVLDWLLHKAGAAETIVDVNGIHLVPASVRMYDREHEFSLVSARFHHTELKKSLEQVAPYYDYILIDCPPSFSVFTQNALIASDFALIPTLLDVLSLQGIDQVLSFISGIIASHNPQLQVLGVVGVNVDERRQLTYEVLEFIRDNYTVNIFNNYIRANVKAAEAPSFAQSVIDYAPASNSAKDYLALVKEVLTATHHSSSLIHH